MSLRWLALVGVLLSAPAWAADKCWPQGGSVYVLSSLNYTPDVNGIDVRGFDQYLSANFIKTAGTINTTVQVKLDGGDWVDAAGVLSSNFHGALNPYQHIINRVRFQTTVCTGCSATLKVCGRANSQ